MDTDIESGLEEENRDNPNWFVRILRKLVWEIREKSLLGFFLSSTVLAILISTLILLLLFGSLPLQQVSCCF